MDKATAGIEATIEKIGAVITVFVGTTGLKSRWREVAALARIGYALIHDINLGSCPSCDSDKCLHLCTTCGFRDCNLCPDESHHPPVE